MRYIFMISGYSKSGKDTLADYLVAHKSYKKYAIATELKQIVAQHYKLEPELLQTQAGKSTVVTRHGQTVRDLLIQSAIRVKQMLGENVFIAKTLSTIHNDDCITLLCAKPLQHVVISDWRYTYEYTYVLDKLQERSIARNAVPTQIVTLRIDRGLPKPNEHSEIQLDTFNFDHVISNTTSIADLHKKIDTILFIQQTSIYVESVNK